MQSPTPDSSTTAATGHGGAAPEAHEGHMCAECAAKMGATQHAEQYVYAIGRLDVRFSSLGIEREYQQRERALSDLPQQPRTARILAVLEKNPHLASRVTYLLLIGGTPVYALTPGTGSLKDPFFKALANAHDANHSAVVIGRVAGFSNAASTGGLLLSQVSVDQLYEFSAADWAENLAKAAGNALKSRNVDAGHFRTVSQGIFRDVVGMPENMGVSDGHRALNYLLVQHPGMFLAAAERSGHTLDRIETRITQTVAGRRHVAVILTFLDRSTGVPERVYTTVDVTEEWPFVASAEGVQPLGFAPFLENTVFASA